VKLKEDAHKAKMMETEDDNFNVTKEDFDDTIDKLASKRKCSYDFIVKSSKEFKDTVFKLTKMMVEKETFPSRFF
jgi:hypothetical protein